MQYTIQCQNTLTGTMYDITTLVDSVTHDTFISGQPGKCTFTVHDDPGNRLQIVNGSIITFSVNGRGIFYGYVFSMETSRDGDNKITAYDQIRYLQNKEVYVTEGVTASQIFELVCSENFGESAGRKTDSQYKVVTPSVWIPEYKIHNGTLYEVIQYGIEQSIVHEAGKYYFIRDNYGTLEFTELAQCKTNYIIGDGSLLTDYTYKLSIDKDVYNRIKITRTDKEVGRIISHVSPYTESQKQWGVLQMVEEIDTPMSVEQMTDLAAKYLKRYNREAQTLKLNALGVPELIAGSGFTLSIAKLGIKQDMWIVSASHNYQQGLHTMQLEVSIMGGVYGNIS